jgi:hypothetical protein
VQVDGIPDATWTEWLHGFEDATIYQTPEYGAISWGAASLSRLAILEGGRPVAMAQLRIVRLPVIRAGIAYLRWGPLWRPKGRETDAGRLREVLSAIKQEYAVRQGLMIRVLPQEFAEDDLGAAAATEYAALGFSQDPVSSAYRTIRMNVSGPIADVRKSLDQKWRNQLNGAERNQLTVLEGTGDDLYAKFLSIYNEMTDRKRFDTTVDVDEFRRIQAALPEPSKLRILVCEKDGVLLSALVNSLMGDTGVYLLGATSTAGMKSKGSYLLHWRFIQLLNEQGCRYYDLGGINPETNPGVYHFKQGFGGQDVRHIPRQEFAAGLTSVVAVRTAERLSAAAASLRRLMHRS